LSDHVPAQEGQTRKGPQGRRPRARQMSDERFDDERGLNEREIAEDRDYDEDDRLELFLETQHQTVLPNLPVMDGYHVCWLTTSNPRDSISWRISIGYQLIRVEECPGWEGIGSQVGNYGGVVGVNEMLAARIRLTLYNKLMAAVGHALPLREEEKLRANSRLLRERAIQRGIEVQEGDGTANIVQRAGPMPVFTE
jgi:hypothetical protein